MVVLERITVNEVKEAKELWVAMQRCLTRSKNHNKCSKFEENQSWPTTHDYRLRR